MRDTTNVSFMLYPGELERLNRLAEDRKLSKAELFRQALSLLEAQPEEWWRGLKLTRVPGGVRHG